MDYKLKGKVVFISGSTAGIGFASARLFIKEGAKVILNGRSEENLEKAVSKFKVEFPGHDIHGVACDFMNEKDIEKLITQLGDVDVLVNNVGIYTSSSFYETPDTSWAEMFEVNVMSGVRLSRSLLPGMIEKGWGRIIFVSSECAQLVPKELIAYSTTKAAMNALSRGLAQIVKATGVTVNTVMPGSTLTEGAQNFLEKQAEIQGTTADVVEEEFFRNIRTSSLVQRFLTPDEIAHGILYLASELSSGTNGSTLKLDGGSIGGII